MILKKDVHQAKRKTTQKRKSKLGTVLAFTIISSQVMTVMTQANEVKKSAITPQVATYGYFVDTYKNNSKDNMTTESNPTIGVLSGFLKFWTPGTEWNNGTKLNTFILDTNIQKSAEITKNRTKQQGIEAYLDDRRDQSYSTITGLGPYAESFIAGVNAGTTILNEIPADAIRTKYEDGGNSNGKWADEDSQYGNMVKLVNTLRGSVATTSPAKAYFQYPRPFRWNDRVTILPTLVPAKKDDPSSDGGFPSGHTNAAYLASFALAYAVPERYDEMLTRASEIGNDRIVAGMHSCMDVIGGRVMATAVAASILNDPENQSLKEVAYNEARQLMSATQDTTMVDRFSDYETNKKNYIERLTYGFEQTGDTTKAMVVPKGAEVLLETRLPYLNAEQRRWVLYSTGLPSGYEVLDDVEGWGRLNLFAASNGYGAFDTDVTVTMDASKGGFNASDSWLNDISGSGKLTKRGTGTLSLNGNNTYTGGTILEEGYLKANHVAALGKGKVVNNGGTLTEDVAGKVIIRGDFTQAEKGELELNIGSDKEILEISGKASLNGVLKINFVEGYVPTQDITLMTYGSYVASHTFAKVEVTGLPEKYETKVVYGEKALQLAISNK